MERTPPIIARAWARIAASMVVFGTLVAWASATPATGASSSTVVTALIPSATTLDVTACQSGSAVGFGTVQPGSPASTAADCAITFGSSNDSSRLRIRQADGGGAAMYLPTDGTLDPAYDTDGIRIEPGFTGTAYDGILQPADGKLVVAGGSGGQLAVMRYTTAGAPDPTFNAGAPFLLNRTPCVEEFKAVALQSDGKIIAVGSSMNVNSFATCDGAFNSNYYDTVVVRVNTNGTIDNTFGVGGVRVINNEYYDDAYGVVVLPDDRIVTAGLTGPALGRDGVAYRLTASGTVESSRIVPLAPNGWFDAFTRVVALSDGSTVFAGAVDNLGGTVYDTTVVKLNPAFALDTSFGGGDGHVVLNHGGNDGAYGIAAQPDGKLLVSGLSNGDAMVARYLANGTGLDATFGTGGVARVDLGSADDAVARMTIEGDGRILAAGATNWNSAGGSPSSDVALVRLRADGSPDTTLDGDGALVLDTSGGSADVGFSVAPVIDGTVVVVGSSNGRFLSMRMSGEPISEWQLGANDWSTGSEMFGACLRQVGLATPSWTVQASCTQSDAAHWNAIGTTNSSVAYTAGPGTTATANLRFGVKYAASQRPGTYIAPLTFDVVAPS